MVSKLLYNVEIIFKLTCFTICSSPARLTGAAVPGAVTCTVSILTWIGFTGVNFCRHRIINRRIKPCICCFINNDLITSFPVLLLMFANSIHKTNTKYSIDFKLTGVTVCSTPARLTGAAVPGTVTNTVSILTWIWVTRVNL